MICAACGRPKLLDAFAGEGGAGAGYMDAGFCVDAVDTAAARLRYYPRRCEAQTIIHGDALAHIAAHGREYAAIHASPPCTGYSRGTAALPDRLDRYDRLIPAVRDLLIATRRPYVIENVEDARDELIEPLRLCWKHFHDAGSVTDDDGTPLTMKRHRLFESNIYLGTQRGCEHPRSEQVAGAYGGARRDKTEARRIRRGGYVPSSDVQRRLLGTPWMSSTGCKLSIPPVYTRHIGAYLLRAAKSTPVDVSRATSTALDPAVVAGEYAHTHRVALGARAEHSTHSATGDHAHDLAVLLGRRMQLDRETAAAVAAARKAGLSWAQVGACLGVSKQAAQQRYGAKARSTAADPDQLTISDA